MRALVPSGALLGALVLASVPSSQAKVLVVDDDGGPGVDFTSVVLAAKAAQDGDVLLVKEGSYVPDFTTSFATPDHLVVNGKSLAIVAEDGALVRFDGGLEVAVLNLSASQSVSLRGIRGNGGAWKLRTNQGPVWLENVTLRAPSFAPAPGAPLLDAKDCASVVLNRCSINGQQIVPELPAFTGVHARSSTVHVYDAVLVGGGSTFSPPNQPGLLLEGGFLFASGTTFTGGSTTFGGGLAPALVLTGTSPIAKTLGSVFNGGVDVQSGVLSPPIPQLPRSFAVDATLRAGEVGSATFQGQPGDVAILEFKLRPGGTFFPALNGSFVLELPAEPTLLVGIVPPSGTVALPVSIGTLPPGFDAIPVFAQAGYGSAAGAIVLGGGSEVVFLRAGL